MFVSNGDLYLFNYISTTATNKATKSLLYINFTQSSTISALNLQLVPNRPLPIWKTFMPLL